MYRMLSRIPWKYLNIIVRHSHYGQVKGNGPQHMICFKQWNAGMVMDVVKSAMNLKRKHRNTHFKRLKTLKNSTVVILQEVNEPVLNLAVSKAVSLLGGSDITVNTNLVWDHDYNGGIFSLMSDAIFVSTTTHWCLQRFADRSPVPVICMRSRTHGTIQSLATIMAIVEQYGTMESIGIAYLGSPHPVLNSYLLLCPMLGANFRFKCCCKECPVSPVLYKSGELMTQKSGTECKQCSNSEECLKNATVFISGPTTKDKTKLPEFKLTIENIKKATSCNWIYIHTTPRGLEVSDDLFYGKNSKTMAVFENTHFISAALLAYCAKNYVF